MTEDSFSGFHSLPAGTSLHGVYEILETIGAGGFAITYRGVRQDTGEEVAIKEYFPPSLAVRKKQEGFYALHPFPEKNTGLFQKGLRRFINEAGILKSFQHLESIVSVFDLFEENDTAYLVMEYIDGLTLGQYVTENGTLTFPEISELMAPVIRSLAHVHARGLIHRDISPDNLILGTDNRLHLIDFGAASREDAGNTQNTVIIKAGYAPPEQYLPNGRLGAWIDIYAICATIYFSVTGHAPAEAISRLDADSGQPLPQLGQLLPWQYEILEKGLQMRPADRFQSAGELYAALTGTEEKAGEVTMLHTNTATGRRSRRTFASGSRRLTLGRSAVRIRRALTMVIGIAILSVLVVSLFRVATGSIQGEKTFPGTSDTGNPSMGDKSVASDSAVRPSPSSSKESQLSQPLETIAAQKPAVLVMPDVTGKTLRKAKKEIRLLDRSIRIDVTKTYDESVGAGKVVRQSIAKGVSFTKNQIPSISLTVSKGKKPLAAEHPKSKGQAGKSADYKVNGDDDYVSIPLE